MENRKHYAAGILAFVIWGFFAIPLRALIAYSSGEILYFRILFSLLILVLVIAGFRRKHLSIQLQLFKSLPKDQRQKAIMLTLVGGALLTINWLTFIYIVNHINIKTASFSYLICPVITAVLGFMLLSENLTRLQWAAVALCAISCLIMGFNSRLELTYSVLTAFTYALYLISQRTNQGFDRIIVLGIQVLFSFIMLTLMVPWLVDQIPSAPDFYMIIFIVAAVFTVLPLFLNLFALNKINSATIGILMYINPIFNFSVAILFFKESITLLQMIGYAIILGALALFNYSTVRKFRTALTATKI